MFSWRSISVSSHAAQRAPRSATVPLQRRQKCTWALTIIQLTRFTTTGPIYPEVFLRYHIGVLAPPPEHQKLVDDVIFNELVHGLLPESSRLRYNYIIE